MSVHPTAVVDTQAELDSSVEVGPYAIIEGPVKIGAGTRIRAHAHISGWTEIGRECDIYPYAVVGGEPQDFHWNGQRSFCKVGDRVKLREGASIHRGSQPESTTLVGDDTVLLTQAHVGHNCEIGRGVQIQHGTLLAGHVIVHDKAILAACAMVHQFCRVGSLAFVTGASRISMDVPPFMAGYGDAVIGRYNVLGMRRAGYTPADLAEVRWAFKTLYRQGLPFRKAIELVVAKMQTPAGRVLADFLQHESQRGYCAAQRRRHAASSESATV